MSKFQLVKRSESVNRNYTETGMQNETLNSVNYRVMRDGNEIGSADVYAGNFNINIYSSGGTIEENTEIVEKMFDAIKEEE